MTRNPSESSSKRIIPTRTVRAGHPSSGLAQPAWSHVCPHCARAFPSSHAVGGHQNAHRRLKKHAAIGFLGSRAGSPNGADQPPPVKPVPVRVYCVGDDGVPTFPVMPGRHATKPPVEISFIPGAAMAMEMDTTVSDEEGSRLSDESVEVNSNWELDLDLKL